jgi:hypothetical protein
MPETLEFLDGEPGICRIAALRNVMIVHWTARADGSAVKRVSNAFDHMLESYATGCSAIHIISSTAGVPTPEGRAGLIEIMNERASKIACVAVVVGGTGFWASTMRSFVTGLRFMTPRNFELRLHGKPAEALEWLPKHSAKLTGVQVDEKALARALEAADTWPSDGSDVFSSGAH